MRWGPTESPIFRKPYLTSPGSIFEKGEGPLVEVPLSALFFPHVGTTMRIFPRTTSMQRWVLHQEAAFTGKPIVFDIHPNEFLDESAEVRVVHRRSRNPITYLLKDLIRSKLKVKNLGPAAVPLYRREIQFYRSRGYRFPTLRQYCETLNLL